MFLKIRMLTPQIRKEELGWRGALRGQKRWEGGANP
jgi:hypothetical protein